MTATKILTIAAGLTMAVVAAAPASAFTNITPANPNFTNITPANPDFTNITPAKLARGWRKIEAFEALHNQWSASSVSTKTPFS